MILFSVSNRQRTEKSDGQSKLQDALKRRVLVGFEQTQNGW